MTDQLKKEQIGKLRLLEAGGTLKASLENEGFVFHSNGTVQTILPGCEYTAVNPSSPCLMIQRNSFFQAEIGAGNIRTPDGALFGGYALMQCTLLSPRRFAIQCQDALLEGKSCEELLTNRLRQAFSAAFSRCADGMTEPSLPYLWMHLKRETEHVSGQALLSWGWQLNKVQIKHMEYRKEEYHEAR